MYHIILTGAFCKYKRSQIIIFIFILSLIWLPSKFFPYFLQYLANKQYVNLKFLWVLLLWTDKPTSIRKKNKKTKTLLYINSDVKITCPFFLKKKKKISLKFPGPTTSIVKKLERTCPFFFFAEWKNRSLMRTRLIFCIHGFLIDHFPKNNNNKSSFYGGKR